MKPLCGNLLLHCAVLPAIARHLVSVMHSCCYLTGLGLDLGFTALVLVFVLVLVFSSCFHQ